MRKRTLGPPLENNPKTPPSSRDEGLRLLHGVETNLATSLQTPQDSCLKNPPHKNSSYSIIKDFFSQTKNPTHKHRVFVIFYKQFLVNGVDSRNTHCSPALPLILLLHTQCSGQGLDCPLGLMWNGKKGSPREAKKITLPSGPGLFSTLRLGIKKLYRQLIEKKGPKCMES